MKDEKTGLDDWDQTANRKAIGERLKQFRDDLKLSLKDFACGLLTTGSNVSEIEKGKIFPSVMFLNALNIKYNLSIDWLILNDGPMIKEPGKEKLPWDISRISDERVQDMIFLIAHSPEIKKTVLEFFREYKRDHHESSQLCKDKIGSERKE